MFSGKCEIEEVRSPLETLDALLFSPPMVLPPLLNAGISFGILVNDRLRKLLFPVVGSISKGGKTAEELLFLLVESAGIFLGFGLGSDIGRLVSSSASMNVLVFGS